jgi:hypothetical protein
MNLVTATQAPENLSQSVNDMVAEGGPALASDDKTVTTKRNWQADIAHLAPDVRARLMTKYSITYNGRHYERGEYRYDSLADAVIYAKLQHSLGRNEIGPKQRTESVEVPNALQRQLMTELGITFQDGVYRCGAFRYERLSDAIDYVHLKWHCPVQA